MEPALPAGVYELRDSTRAHRLARKADDGAITQALSFPNAAFWEMGDEEGIYYLTDILVGVRATVNIVVFPRSKRWLRKRTPHHQMFAYVMRVYNLTRLQAAISADNTLSNRLALALGMHHEGVMRDYGYVQSVLKDFNLYSLTREEVMP
jgi:hypothetical protein